MPISIGCAVSGELDNIGWDEAIAGAIAIVEWPERMPEALPGDRLEVEIRFDSARGADFRLDAARHRRDRPASRAGARGREALGGRRLERRKARIPARGRIDSRL